VTVGSWCFSADQFGTPVSYGYDQLNRLATVTDSQGGVTTQSFDENGNLAGVAYGNGVTTSHSFDSLNRLTQLETVDGIGTVLQSYAYTLAVTGHRTRIDEQGGVQGGVPGAVSRNYSYDALYRLTEDRVEDGAGALVYSETFGYDRLGIGRA